MRAVGIIALAGLISVGGARTAGADVSVDCRSRDPDTAIAGCTRFLQGSGLKPNDRSLAYGIRGRAYADKGMIEEALADASRWRRKQHDRNKRIRLSN